jgi:hypothetical protein
MNQKKSIAPPADLIGIHMEARWFKATKAKLTVLSVCSASKR